MDTLNYENVLKYFEEISKIPRETGKEKQISDYLVNFAKKRELEVIQDELFNVIIKKKSTIQGYDGPAVVLQGHMDMVYEKAPGSYHNYENGIEVIKKDGFLYGNKTTLGADNGIAVAYFLALLDSKEIIHPDLEIIITTQEEAGLVGAQGLDVTNIKGKYLINMDAEEEGVFVTSCAGGMRSYIHIPTSKESIKGYVPLTILIDGLKGGHSGLEIDQERGNAIKLLGRLLYKINSDDLFLLSISAHGKANVISNKAKVIVMINANKKKDIIFKIKEIETIFKNELKFTDNISIDIIEENNIKDSYNAYTQKCKDKIIDVLMLMPFGVINNSFSIPGLVQTSTNIGSLEESEDRISILSSSRSSVRSQKYNIADHISIIANALGASCEFFNDYPEWEYNPHSKLRNIIEDIYKTTFNKKPIMTAIHAGLECGYFASKLDNIDIISFGPNLYKVHTINEHVSIESVKNVWVLLLKLLESLSVCN